MYVIITASEELLKASLASKRPRWPPLEPGETDLLSTTTDDDNAVAEKRRRSVLAQREANVRDF